MQDVGLKGWQQLTTFRRQVLWKENLSGCLKKCLLSDQCKICARCYGPGRYQKGQCQVPHARTKDLKACNQLVLNEAKGRPTWRPDSTRGSPSEPGPSQVSCWPQRSRCQVGRGWGELGLGGPQGGESSPSWQPARKLGPQSHSHRNRIPPTAHEAPNPGHSRPSLGLTHGHWGAIKGIVLATKFVVICHAEVDNQSTAAWVSGSLQPL